ncbi:ABC transporter permease [Vibrio genomosp. F10]|uniref:ABC transporter permease n=1 Tax=Vibrio genomosp. F10 TaxID=723171 RepID=UPI0003031E48|nr:ABC transporter permease [Vibrio genomosp. F10]OEF07742.1 ABC transporter [Vibrio genomosp. F10 str. 9ZB36]
MSFVTLLKSEIRDFFNNKAVILTVFGGVIFYSFLYPLPYSQQSPLEQKIAIVNLDNSAVSFKLERMVNAAPQVQVIQRSYSIEAAKSDFIDGKISGILVIPEHFYKDLMIGKSPTLAYAGDASYFLVYGTVVEGLAQTGATLGAEVKVAQLIASGEPIVSAANQYSSIKANLKPTFNPRMGYVDYVVPAVFVLILQQTLVMAAGLLTATQKSVTHSWTGREHVMALLARTVLLVGVYLVLSGYYFGASFSYYGISTLAKPHDIVALLIPFLVACCLVGYVIGYWVPRRELVTVIVLISSMPLIFLAGFIWPIEMIPTPLLWFAQSIPSTSAIPGFLSLNQKGASWQQVASQFTHLWLLVLLWLLALGGVIYKQIRICRYEGAKSEQSISASGISASETST